MTVRAVSNNPVSAFYNSSAPNLTGAAGSLTTLLDAVLVNGFSGFTNLGWTIGFTTTNKRAYLQNLTGSNNPSGMYLYVDDTAPTTAKEARACGFETMSNITPTGTGQFPTSSQSLIGVGTVVIRKSTTADSTTRFWTIIGDGHTFYLFTETSDQTNPFAVSGFAFGDYFSYKTSDQYAVMIIGRTVENSTNNNCEALCAIGSDNANAIRNVASLVCIGHYTARSWTGVGGSKLFSVQIEQTRYGVGSGSNSGLCGNTAQTGTTLNSLNLSWGREVNVPGNSPYPSPVDGSLVLSPAYVCHDGAWRGVLKGFWCPVQDRPLNHNDTYTVSSGNLNGKSFLVQTLLFGSTSSATDVCQPHVETSDTWALP